jgi:hypothetical protein
MTTTTDASWTQIHLPEWKGHAVSKGLLPKLLQDYAGRGHGVAPVPEFIQDIAEMALDRPGMVSATRRWIDVPVEPGFQLSFPYQDAEYFLGELDRLPVRHFSDGMPYVKLHGWIHCVVLDMFQHGRVRDYLRAHLADIRAVAKEEGDRFDAAMADIEKASGGRVIRIQALKNDDIPAGVPVAPVNRERN